MDSQTHIFRHHIDWPAEHDLVKQHTSHGMRVLDIGTGATGRSAKILANAGCEVVSIDYNKSAISEFNSLPEARGITLAAADACALPFADASFGCVLFAFHGSDYLVNPLQRATAYAEMSRVCQDGGHVIINAFNRRGIVCGLHRITSLGLAYMYVRYWLRGQAFTRTFNDLNGLTLHQASPAYIVREIELTSGLRLSNVIDPKGKGRGNVALSFFESEPYYVFTKC